MPDQASKPPRRDLIAVIVALALPSAITWVYFYGAEAAPAGVQLVVFNAVKVLQFVFPVVWVAFIQRRLLILRPQHTEGVAAGLAFGALVAAGIFALYVLWLRTSPVLVDASEEIREKVSGFGINSVWKYAALGLFYSLCHSFLEEYYWRWFVFGELRRWTSAGPAIAISSMGFTAHHVLVLGKFFGFDHWATWLFSGCVGVGGAVWAWLYERTGSLSGPWLSHLLVDAAIFAVGFDIVRKMLAD